MHGKKMEIKQLIKNKEVDSVNYVALKLSSQKFSMTHAIDVCFSGPQSSDESDDSAYSSTPGKASNTGIEL